MKLSLVTLLILVLAISTLAQDLTPKKKKRGGGKKLMKCRARLAESLKQCEMRLEDGETACGAQKQELQNAAASGCQARVDDAVAACNDQNAELDGKVVEMKRQCEVRLKDGEDACGDEKKELQKVAETGCQARVTDALKACSDSNAELQEKVARLHEKLLETGAQYIIQHCGADNAIKWEKDYFAVGTAGGQWNRDGWCIILDREEGNDDTSFTVSVELYADNSDECHLGLAYNVVDINNYDFIYYRPHSEERCYQAGSVDQGVTKFGERGPCPMQLDLESWFRAKLVVTGSNKVEFYLNDELSSDKQKMAYTPNARAGIILANGYENQAHFRNLKIE